MYRTKPVLMSLIAVILIVGMLSGGIRPAHALTQGVNLDAQNISQTDTTRAPTFSNAHGFRVGAILNTTLSDPIQSVYGWQFTIGYNASAFIPQGDPSAASLYPDGAANTVLFGASSSANWAGLIGANQAFGGSTTSVAGSVGEINVFITLISPAPAQTISAANLLASVSFELLPGHQIAAYTFTISNVIFVNNAGSGIPGPIAGLGATETVTDNPPVASTTFSHLATGDPSCVPLTGLACTPYAYSFDGSGSTGGVVNPTGFFWDFGDGVQDLATTGAVVVHDYGASGAVVPAKFNVTLRVANAAGDTGAARDSLGKVILNVQPSHTQVLNLLVDQLPTASFTATPSTGSPPLTVNFDATASTDPDGTVAKYFWNFGDGSVMQTTAIATTSHVYGLGTFTASLIVQDNTGGNSTNTSTQTIIVSQAAQPPVVTVNAPTPNPANTGQTVTVTFTVTSTTTVTGITVNWGDGTPIDNLPGTATSDTHSYANTGNAKSQMFTITVIATNSAGPGQGQTTETVNDRPPTVTISTVSPSPANTGQTVTLSFTATDPDGTIASISVNWGDGTAPDSLAGTATSDTHVYANTGALKSQVFTIMVTATDNSGSTGSASTQETINDRPPFVTITNLSPNPANTGQLVTITFTTSDPDGTVSSITVNWGDTSPVDTLAGSATSDTHTYSGAGPFTITVTATDNSGSTGQSSMGIIINSIGVPVVTVNSPTPNPANPGETVTVTFTVTSSVTVTGITVNWGDGTTPDSLAGTATSDTHVYASSGSVKSASFMITVTATNSAGPGSGTTSETVNDIPPSVSIVVASPNPANTGQTVTIQLLAGDPDGTIASITVNWGDGTPVDTLPGSATSDTHTYTSTGNVKSQIFTITATATDNSGSTASVHLQETVNDLPPVVSVTNVSPSPTNTGQIVTVTFTATDPDGTISSVTVNWGDSTAPDTLPGTATSDTHTYSTPGSFTITVTATDNSGSTGQGTGSITVNMPVGVPTVTVNNPTPNPANTGDTVTVTFTVSSTATVTGITVNWGDGTTPDALAGTATSSMHVYASTGNAKSQIFTITVTAINSAGPGSAITTEVVNDRPPVVTVSSVVPTSPCVGQSVTVSFTATDPDGTVGSISVSWGDGTSADSLPGTATSDAHTYSVGSTFMFTVTATDNSGSTGQASGSVTTVLAGCVPTVTLNSPTPNPATTGETVTITFSFSSTLTVTGATVNWGDGTTPDSLSGSATSDTHVYTSTGSSTSAVFTITVTATNSAGTGSSQTTEMVNDRPPVVSVTGVSPNPTNTGNTVTLTFTATDPDGTISSITVNWGDGSPVDILAGTATSDTHVYGSAGSFTITVSATDNSGSTGQGTGSITVMAILVFVSVNAPTPNPADTGQSVSVTFHASSLVDIASITVDWGDGTTPDSLAGTATTDTHVYASTGTAMSQVFTITVTATNTVGVTGSATTTETVNDRPPVASFTFNPSNPFAGQTVSFDASASTDPDGTVVSYAWNFGDGTTGTGISPTHVYAPATNMTFNVMLTVTDNSGSTASTAQTITVTVVFVSPPVVTITSVSPDPANTGQTVTLSFTVSSTVTVTGITVNWGDSSTPDSLAGTATSDTHVYSSTGGVKQENFTIAVTATNSGGSGSASIIETVNDRPPILTISSVSPNPAGIGQTVTASFTATDPDGTVSSIVVNWGDGTLGDNLAGTSTIDTHSYAAAGNFTISITATDNSGSIATANTIETVTTVTVTPIVLTFQAFNFTAFHDGFGSFQVLVNGHLVTSVGIPFVPSATITDASSAPGANKFVSFGPFDITAFVVPGVNNVTFINPTSSRFSLIRNVMIVQGNTVFLNVNGARFVSPGRPVTFTFSNPPLTTASFIVSNTNPFVEQEITFTASYTGGTGPFKCLFRFGDGNLWGVTGTNGSCSVTTDYDTAGVFTPSVRITGSTTGDDRKTVLATSVDAQPDTAFTTTSTDIATQSQTATNLQSFTFTVTNPSSQIIIFRIDTLVTLPDQTQTWIIGKSYSLNPGQTTIVILQSYPPAGQHGTFSFMAALKFGLDTNHDGILQNSEKIATSGRLFGSFTTP